MDPTGRQSTDSFTNGCGGISENHPDYTRVFNDAALFPGVETAEKYPVEEFPSGTEKQKMGSDRLHEKILCPFLHSSVFIFSFIGWLWEVSLHLFTDGIFVNRGVLYGPWLPIYGSGGVLILIFLKRFAKKPVLTYFLIMALCGTVEYTTAWYLETFKGKKWWDYSGYFLNLDGRICAEGLLVFGLGGCAFIYILAPALDDRFRKSAGGYSLFCVLYCFWPLEGILSIPRYIPTKGKELRITKAWFRRHRNG